jgi:glycosyltransferase involved in cell wall biosynthesis
MNPPVYKLVSVAIATYNGEKYLEEQLESIYSQTYKNIEVIVSDDRSTDGTVDILKKYSEKFGLSYSINGTNLGVIKNFENAVSKCSGEYILLSDQDDIWMPGKVEVLLAEIGDFSLIYSDGYIINKDGNREQIKLSGQKWIRPYGLDSSDENLYKYLIFNSFILGSSVMFRRDLLRVALPFYACYRNHDWWLAICADNENGIKYVDQALFLYRIHGENYSINEKLNFFKRIFLLFSHDRIENRKKLHRKESEVFDYLSRSNFFKNPAKMKYGDYINKMHNKASLLSRLRLLLFQLKAARFIFPTCSKLEIIPLLALRTIE